MNRSFLFLADGFEEIEALTVVDVLRRAGMDIKTVAITDNATVTGAHGIPVIADLLLSKTDCSEAEWLILPGGLPGAQHLAACKPLQKLLTDQAAKGGKIAAICASPAMVLGPLGLLNGRECTGYPGTESLVPDAKWRDTPVAALDTIITGQGPSSALRFALAIVANSMGEAAAQQIGGDMLFFPRSANFYF